MKLSTRPRTRMRSEGSRSEKVNGGSVREGQGQGAVSPPRKDEMFSRDNRKVRSGYIFSRTAGRWKP
ncbi:hypothetical protein KL86PLE_30056 [uncultured Pleomorphomonas sp.]|uniref:Uncharacterized protein n=1 Tax=uncultured Pleomorphomonas sp. TaxID=442121 RepID=A0A212LE24_9HYPH|nr:hypothetical protein KL86PLE_30056 [uncultured Pleomorphomonas sp.]